MKRFISYLLSVPIFLVTFSGFGNLFMGDYVFDIYFGLASIGVGFIGIFLLYKYGKF